MPHQSLSSPSQLIQLSRAFTSHLCPANIHSHLESRRHSSHLSSFTEFPCRPLPHRVQNHRTTPSTPTFTSNQRPRSYDISEILSQLRIIPHDHTTSARSSTSDDNANFVPLYFHTFAKVTCPPRMDFCPTTPAPTLSVSRSSTAHRTNLNRILEPSHDQPHGSILPQRPQSRLDRHTLLSQRCRWCHLTLRTSNILTSHLPRPRPHPLILSSSPPPRLLSRAHQ